MESLQLHDALAVIEDVVRQADRYVEEQRPWVLAKDATQHDRLREVLGNLCELLRHVSLMFHPFMPETAGKIFTALGQAGWRSERFADLQEWGRMKEGTAVEKLAHLFPALQ